MFDVVVGVNAAVGQAPPAEDTLAPRAREGQAPLKIHKDLAITRALEGENAVPDLGRLGSDLPALLVHRQQLLEFSFHLLLHAGLKLPGNLLLKDLSPGGDVLVKDRDWNPLRNIAVGRKKRRKKRRCTGWSGAWARDLGVAPL